MLFLLKKGSLVLVCVMSVFYCAAQNYFFEDLPEKSLKIASNQRAIIPAKYRTVKLNKAGLLNFLTTVTSEKANVVNVANSIIEIPLPLGGTAKFYIWESSTMEAGLAAKFPGIHTFTGQGIDDPTANIKLDFTPTGFHAMIISSLGGAIFVDPYARGNTDSYISYKKTDFKKAIRFFELPVVRNLNMASRPLSANVLSRGTCMGSQLRTYRLALAATAEYTAALGGTVNAAQAAQVTTINRVNGVYEREVGVRMVLVSNNNLLIYSDAATDGFTNNDGGTMLDENQRKIDLIIGSANYDIGHVFSTGGGGVAALGVVCAAGQKAKGVTGSPFPAGDPFDIDYVAHEIGHQFGANHPFNSITDACNGNGVPFANAEPGSGSTIMAYAGICGTDNLQSNSDAQFHAISLNEISTFILSGNGSTCPQVSATGNLPPVVSAGQDYAIPKSTPFSLVGSASDANGDALTFSWEQINVGAAFGTWNNPSGNAPIFRSFIPQSVPIRNFPQLSDVINNTASVGELLPTYARTLDFRLTARDNRAGGGGICFDEMAITVNVTAGPFLITYPSTTGITWFVNDFKTILWDPSGTETAPINCSNVKIELSLDGGISFPIVIASSTPNDGVEEIQVPNNVSSSARIRIKAVGNIFYDISNANFSIQTPPAAGFVFNTPTPVNVCSVNSGAASLHTASLSGFSTPINLSASKPPAGATVLISKNPVMPGDSSLITLANTAALAAGVYNISVTGVAGSITKTSILSFVVSSLPGTPPNLIAPFNNEIGVSTLASFNWSKVSGDAFYTLDISTESNFTSIIQSVSAITIPPFVLPSALAENTIYYWRVSAYNNCGKGNFSTIGFFKTGLATCKYSSDVPKFISSNGTPTINSTLTIPAQSGVTINDLNLVGLSGRHSYINDLTVTLTSPAGTKLVIFDTICNNDADFNINLDDEASLTVIPCPPIGNQTVRPQHPLSAFDGESSTGTWILTIKDNYDQDGGNLNAWGLVINSCSFIATPILLSAVPWNVLCPPFSNTSLTSNITGSNYQWQVNKGTAYTDVRTDINFSGVNTSVMQINNAPSSWTGYQFRCLVDGNSSAEFTLGFTSVWNGSVSTAWENAANWSCNSVPDENTDVIIQSGTVVVNSSAVCRSIKASLGSVVTVNSGYAITVAH